MANSFADLKKSRNKDLEKLTSEISKLSDKEKYDMKKCWDQAVKKGFES